MLERLVLKYVRERVARGELVGATAQQYRSRLLDFAQSTPQGVPLTRRHVEKWLERDGLSTHYRRARLSAVRGFTQWCVLNGHMEKDPCIGIPLPRLPELLPRYLSSEEMANLMRECRDTRTKLAALLMCQEMLRRGECARLEVGDLDLGKRIISVRGKGGRGDVTRREPITDETYAVLRAYLTETRQHAGPLFRSRRDVHKPVTGATLGDDVTKAMYRAGVKNYAFDGRSPHALRHTGAQDLADAGVDMRVVQKALGHKTIRSTELYVRGDVNGLREAMGGRTYGGAEHTCADGLRKGTIRSVTAADPRYCVAQVSDECRVAWRDFCEAYGIDRTTFAEVVGVWMTSAPDSLPEPVATWVQDALDLKNQRKRRG